MISAHRIRTMAAGIALGTCLVGAGQAVAQEYFMKVPVAGLQQTVWNTFISHRFTNCGQTGMYGPSLSQCQSVYNGSEILKPKYSFSVNDDGYQYWMVPADGTYQINAAGAKGGDEYGPFKGGTGIQIQGNFELNQGDQLILVVGQKGEDGPATATGGGGGGGSFVAKGVSPSAAVPLIVAGGGGGPNARHYYGDGSTYVYPRNARNANNGDVSRDWGGYQGNGASYSQIGETNGSHALPFTNSARGGKGGCYYQTEGGFGGGGAQGCANGGGGGGYTGGAGGKSVYHSGEGGGSYNVGQDPSAVGANNGHGFIEIEFVQ